jgi:hypothetical protein
MYWFFVSFYVLFVCKCVLLPPVDNPTAVNKYIIYHTRRSYCVANVPHHCTAPLYSGLLFHCLLVHSFTRHTDKLLDIPDTRRAVFRDSPWGADGKQNVQPLGRQQQDMRDVIRPTALPKSSLGSNFIKKPNVVVPLGTMPGSALPREGLAPGICEHYVCHSEWRRQTDRKYIKFLRRIGHDIVPFFSVELHDCLQNEMCQCRVLRVAGELPNRLMWRCAGVAVDEHDMMSVGGEQNFKIVLLQG